MPNSFNELPKITFRKFRLSIFLFTNNDIIRTRASQAVTILDRMINKKTYSQLSPTGSREEKELYVVDPSIIKKRENDIGALLNSDKFLVLLYGGPADHLITAQSVRHVVNSEIEPDELASIIGDLAGIKNMDRAPRLSQREKEILQYYGRGYTLKAIGYELGISPKSAETYKSRACRKLGLTGRAAVLRFIDPSVARQNTLH